MSQAISQTVPSVCSAGPLVDEKEHDKNISSCANGYEQSVVESPAVFPEQFGNSSASKLRKQFFENLGNHFLPVSSRHLRWLQSLRAELDTSNDPSLFVPPLGICPRSQTIDDETPSESLCFPHSVFLPSLPSFSQYGPIVSKFPLSFTLSEKNQLSSHSESHSRKQSRRKSSIDRSNIVSGLHKSPFVLAPVSSSIGTRGCTNSCVSASVKPPGKNDSTQKNNVTSSSMSTVSSPSAASSTPVFRQNASSPSQNYRVPHIDITSSTPFGTPLPSPSVSASPLPSPHSDRLNSVNVEVQSTNGSFLCQFDIDRVFGERTCYGDHKEPMAPGSEQDLGSLCIKLVAYHSCVIEQEQLVEAINSTAPAIRKEPVCQNFSNILEHGYINLTDDSVDEMVPSNTSLLHELVRLQRQLNIQVELNDSYREAIRSNIAECDLTQAAANRHNAEQELYFAVNCTAKWQQLRQSLVRGITDTPFVDRHTDSFHFCGHSSLSSPCSCQDASRAPRKLTRFTDNVADTSDDFSVCSVCFDGQSVDSNPIVFCENCNVAVHQSCYGISSLPEGDWYCQFCQERRQKRNSNFEFATDEATSKQCVLCSVEGGALKKTDDNQWTHIACALWIKDVFFGDILTMEPIRNVGEVLKHNIDQTKCFVCGSNHGVCVRCSAAHCETSFHPLCAWYHGLYMQIGISGEDCVTYAYCLLHTPAHVHHNPIQRMYEQREMRNRGREEQLGIDNSLIQQKKKPTNRCDIGEDPYKPGTCAVCFNTFCEPHNRLLRCQRCLIFVHQACYGVQDTHSSSYRLKKWVCRRCSHKLSIKVACCLCPRKGGAFKPTSNGKWAHVICALWIPEVKFGKPALMEPVVGVSRATASKSSKPCYLCGKHEGCVIRCNHPHCPLMFHPVCGMFAGTYMKILENAEKKVVFSCFCKKHTDISETFTITLPPQYHQINRLRCDLDKLRTLVDLCRKREKLKKRIFGAMQEDFSQNLSVLDQSIHHQQSRQNAFKKQEEIREQIRAKQAWYRARAKQMQLERQALRQVEQNKEKAIMDALPRLRYPKKHPLPVENDAVQKHQDRQHQDTVVPRVLISRTSRKLKILPAGSKLSKSQCDLRVRRSHSRTAASSIRSTVHSGTKRHRVTHISPAKCTNKRQKVSNTRSHQHSRRKTPKRSPKAATQNHTVEMAQRKRQSTSLSTHTPSQSTSLSTHTPSQSTSLSTHTPSKVSRAIAKLSSTLLNAEVGSQKRGWSPANTSKSATNRKSLSSHNTPSKISRHKPIPASTNGTTTGHIPPSNRRKSSSSVAPNMKHHKTSQLASSTKARFGTARHRNNSTLTHERRLQNSSPSVARPSKQNVKCSTVKMSRDKRVDITEQTKSFPVFSYTGNHPFPTVVTLQLVLKTRSKRTYRLIAPESLCQTDSPVARPLSQTDSPASRPLSQTDSPASRPSSQTDSPVSRPSSQTDSPVSRPLSPTDSPASRPLSQTDSPASRPSSQTDSPVARPLSQTDSPVSRPLSQTDSPVSRPLSQTDSPVSRPLSQTDSPVSRPLSQTDSPVSRPLFQTDSPVARPLSQTDSPVTSNCTKSFSEANSSRTPSEYLGSAFTSPLRAISSLYDISSSSSTSPGSPG